MAIKRKKQKNKKRVSKWSFVSGDRKLSFSRGSSPQELIKALRKASKDNIFKDTVGENEHVNEF